MAQYHPPSRSDQRTRLRERRRLITAERQDQAANAVATPLLQRARAQHWQTVLAYAAHAGELDPAPLVTGLWALGTTVGFPRVEGEELSFREVRPDSAFVPGVFGIPTPAADSPVVAASAADVIVVPLVGFDDQGGRLGMGGGYYDRLLASYPGPRRIGVAHDCQRVSRLLIESWDQRLDEVVTPTMRLVAPDRVAPDAPIDPTDRP
ncbi:MAG: 5-formyltetrahydrofolate cyclo-ligase [Acidimicrobiales bacterium]